MSGIPGIYDKHTEHDHHSTITLPSQKIHPIQKEATHLSLDAVQVRTLAHFIGTLVATRPAVPTGPLHYRALQDLKIKALCQSSSYQVMGQVTKEVQLDLRWWATQLPTCCSSPIVKQEATIVIESDASDSGWGAVYHRVKTGGRWTPVEAQHHVNYLELKAVFLAFQSFLKTKNGITVLYQVRQPCSNCLCKQDGRSCNDTAVFTSTTDLAVVPSYADYPLC